MTTSIATFTQHGRYHDKQLIVQISTKALLGDRHKMVKYYPRKDKNL